MQVAGCRLQVAGYTSQVAIMMTIIIIIIIKVMIIMVIIIIIIVIIIIIIIIIAINYFRNHGKLKAIYTHLCTYESTHRL